MPKHTEEGEFPAPNSSITYQVIQWLWAAWAVVFFITNRMIESFFTEWFQSESFAAFAIAILSFLTSGVSGYYWWQERKTGTNGALVFSLAFAVWGVYKIVQAL